MFLRHFLQNYCDGYIIKASHVAQFYDPYDPITKICPTYYYRVKYYRIVRKWEYIGTNVSSYNGSYNAGGFVGGCRSSVLC